MNDMIEHSGMCSINTSQNQELRFTHGKGAIVYSSDGKKYIDFILGFGPVVLGHSNEEFNRMVSDYLSNGIHFPSYSTHHNEFLSFLKYSKWHSYSFFKTSSESISAAIRLSMAMTHKKEIIRCGFIGWHDAEIANTISWHEYPNSEYRNNIRFTQDFRGVSGNEKVHNWHSFDLDELVDLIKHNNVAVFILDAFQIHFTSVDIIKTALQICNANDVVTVLDETKTSGRVRLLGTSEYYDLKSDFLVMGKAIANGAPLSILCGSEALSKYAKVARITGTFSKEALSIYCALATQHIIDMNNGYDALEKAGHLIVEAFNDVVDAIVGLDIVKAVTVFNGSIIDLYFAGDVLNNKPIRELLRLYLADNGILVLQGHPSFICMAHENLNINYFKECVEQALKTWKRKCF